MVNINQNNIECEEINCILCNSNLKEPAAKGLDYEYWTSYKEFYFVKCKSCGHYYLNPRPKKEYSDKIYPDNYYTFEGRHEKKSSYIISLLKKIVINKRMSFFKSYLNRSISILEIGCGDCSLLIALKTKYPQLRCAGVDLKFSQNHRNRCEHLGISLFESTIEDIELKENSYDLVIMNQLIEHLWDPVEVMKKINHSLSSDGMISIETINISGYDRAFFKNSFWGGYYFPRHMNLFSFESLNRLLIKTGFKIVKQHSLLAPIVWTFSFHALFVHKVERNKSFLSRFFTDKNPLCLFLFTCIDFIALIVRFKTSNQKAIAIKISK